MRRFAILLPVLVIVVGVLMWQVWPGWGASASHSSGQSQNSSSHSTSGDSTGAMSSDNVVPTASAVPLVIPHPTPTPKIIAPIKITDAPVPWVNAEQVVVIDDASGEVLYGRNEHERTPMASVTKIVTAIVALERGKLTDQVDVEFDPEALAGGSMMWVNPGETYTLEDMLYGLMLPSGNDAAVAIANHIAGSEKAFVQMMNDKVAELGLKDTHFVNPHGRDARGQYSSAYDMAMLGRYGMRNTTFRALAKAKLREVHGSRSFTVYNLNRLLWNYDGADGIKIGYDDSAGRTTVATATRDGHRVYVAWMHGGDIVEDVTPLFDYVFDNYKWNDDTRGFLAR